MGTDMDMWRRPQAALVAVALALRVAVIRLGSLQDGRQGVPFTDVDYLVFSDAAKHVAGGGSPYDRHTYRYSPMLAYFALPNVLLHPDCGKFLFALSDAAVGWIIAEQQRPRGTAKALALSCLWLLNPFVIGISCRGSADTLTALLLIAAVEALRREQDVLSAALLGFATHLRLFPVIYGLPVAAFVLTRRGKRAWRGARIRDLALYAAVAAGTFVALLGVFFARYGMQFLEHTYLYHLSRADHRHNMSPFFSLVSQSVLANAHGTLALKLPSLAQWVSSCTVSLVFALPSSLTAGRRFESLEVGLFLQTLLFVAFNRVLTAQYFMWWFAMLPSAIGALRLTKRGASVLSLALLQWVVAEGLWLSQGYALEFLGAPAAFTGIEVCGWAFLGSHIALAVAFIFLF